MFGLIERFWPWSRVRRLEDELVECRQALRDAVAVAESAQCRAAAAEGSRDSAWAKVVCLQGEVAEARGEADELRERCVRVEGERVEVQSVCDSTTSALDDSRVEVKTLRGAVQRVATSLRGKRGAGNRTVEEVRTTLLEALFLPVAGGVVDAR